MASSSSSFRTWRYRVFTSFHGPDVRKTFLSHLRKQFIYNGITMFDDQGIERSQIIAPALTQGIRESRIAIVVLSKNYASSSWCLDELLEILDCKEELGQIVMTVFYGVDPSDVRKQTGDFGTAFTQTCARKTEEQMRKWSQALTFVGNIAGEHFQNWDNEAKMIEKIAADVSDKLNVTPSRDFDGMVGLEAHLRKMESLLDLDYDGAKIVGISGPAGIGKSTIARALHSALSTRFQHNCFMDNLHESNKIGIVEYGLKLRLQEQLLSKILNLDGIRIGHSGVIQERLHDQRVLIILDDVESLDQLEALANIMWFGPGSRVIVTTENKEILQQHGISDIYHVGFPSSREALMIFCLSAFRQISPPGGFMDLAVGVVKLCGNLPLALHVLGSSLRGKNYSDSIEELPRLQTCLDGRIESVLKVGYESLHEKDQALFLYIAVFFNYEHANHVTSMLAKTNLNVRLGLKILPRLKILANRHLIHIDHGAKGKVVMHRLLQVMARQVISKQEPWKRQILVDTQEISYVLENAEGNGSIVGISFDVGEINKLTLSARAFERMHNLFLLKVYDRWLTGKRQLHIPEEMDFLPPLSLLRWDAYQRKTLPRRFCPENLVELHMRDSQLEKLWEGTQMLNNLKNLDLSWSRQLKQIPNLLNATNLERLNLTRCESLVELPLSIGNLHKLEDLEMFGCSRLRSCPNLTTNIDTKDEAVHVSTRKLSRPFTPTRVRRLNLSYTNIEEIPDCIKSFRRLQCLYLSGCKKLASLPELPSSLTLLMANGCESLERVTCPLNTPNAKLIFTNCFKLTRESRNAIIQRSFRDGFACLPGRVMPAEFNQRTRGNSLTIQRDDGSTFSPSSRIMVCVTVSPNQRKRGYRYLGLWGRIIGKSGSAYYKNPCVSPRIQMQHLCIFHCYLPEEEISLEAGSEILIELKSRLNNCKIVECGVRILTTELGRSCDGSNDSRV